MRPWPPLALRGRQRVEATVDAASRIMGGRGTWDPATDDVTFEWSLGVGGDITNRTEAFATLCRAIHEMVWEVSPL